MGKNGFRTKKGREAICLFVVHDIVCIITKVVEREGRRGISEGSDLFYKQTY
jgi:hypothetical protein